MHTLDIARRIDRLAARITRRIGRELARTASTPEDAQSLVLLVVADRLRHLTDGAAKLSTALAAVASAKSKEESR